jgi:hypothetical protein
MLNPPRVERGVEVKCETKGYPALVNIRSNEENSKCGAYKSPSKPTQSMAIQPTLAKPLTVKGLPP